MVTKETGFPKTEENQAAETHPASVPALYNEHLHDILLEISASNL
jgi:hypothetical protein